MDVPFEGAIGLILQPRWENRHADLEPAVVY